MTMTFTAIETLPAQDPHTCESSRLTRCADAAMHADPPSSLVSSLLSAVVLVLDF